MAKRIRILVTAMATILICVALIAVGSYALFSDTTRVKTHLQAGDLDIKLWRIDLAGKGVDSKGLFDDIIEVDDKDFTDPSTSNIFDADDKFIVPGSEYVAEMMISRSASTNVAIGYWLDFVVPTVTADADKYLLESLTLTVEVMKIGATSYTPYIEGVSLADLSTVATADGTGVHYAIGSLAKPIDTIDMQESLTSANIDSDTLGTGEEAIAIFKVTVKFVDDFDFDHILDGDGNLVANNQNPNNLAKNGKVSFDIVVNAVQGSN
jgi:predicted ribosomally synthesized peptide with SipW-like signal peptide